MSIWLQGLVLLALVGFGLAAFVRVAFLREAGRRRLFPYMRPLYKHVFNPSALRGAARGDTRWAVVHHVGRRSGVAYDTPTDAQVTAEGVLIPIVYGPRVDWCRNILAAGQCTLTLNGEEMALSAPEVVPISVAEWQLTPEKARFWRGIGIEHLLSLKRVVSAPER